jgi:toxin ParE1/3/4
VRVSWSDSAIEELGNIHNYIAIYDASAATQIRRDIMLTARKLADFPEIGRPAERAGVRLLVVSGRPYLLAYKIYKDVVEIGSVIDGRMDRAPDLL